MKKILLGFVLVFAMLFTSVYAEDNPRAVIIFDASGSMWGQINGVTKIEIARDALKNVVKEWNPNVELGLTVYGHRSKGDCNDIETIIPVGKIDKNKVIKTVMGIKPKGKTPISRSLRKVAEEIKYTEEKATIILISDGKETCDPDPCGTAKELEAQGIDFVTHVIGFNVDKKTSEQLECIASATGGEYFSAKNAAALNEAMKVIAKKVELVEPPKPTPKPKVKKLDHTVEVSNSEKEDGKWVVAYNSIYEDEDGKAGDRAATAHSRKKSVGKAQIPVGKYILKSVYNDFEVFTPLEVKPGEVTKIHVVMGQTGTVETSASEKEGGKWVAAYNRIYQDEDGKAGDSVGVAHSGKKKMGTKQIPVGKYILKSQYNDFKKETAFEIKAGEVTKIHVVMGETGTVETSASEKEGGKWIGAYNRIYQDEDGKAGESVGVAHSGKKKVGKIQIPVGKYILKSTYNDFKKETPFEIKAGKVTKVHVVMGETGTIETSASEKEGGKWINAYHNIFQDEDGKAGDLIGRAPSQKKNAGENQIPVGKYILKSSYNNFKKETAFEVKAGEVTKIHVVFGQYMISAKCINMDAKINYEIFASSGQLVYEKKMGCSDTLTVTLDNGNYSVEAKVENDTKEVKFTVGGDSSSLVVDMTDIKREPTKEELIKADSQETPMREEVKKEKPAVEAKVSENKPQADNLKDIDKTLGKLGALLGGVTAVANTSDKPLMGLKESLKIAIPSMAETKGCYKIANSVDIVAKCDAMANAGAQKAQDAMNSITGEEQEKITAIVHTEWNDEVKEKELAKINKNLANAKLYLECINKGAKMSQLKECASNNGDFTPKKDELKDLGNLLKMFGNMK